jgi:hypothetical protein
VRLPCWHCSEHCVTCDIERPVVYICQGVVVERVSRLCALCLQGRAWLISRETKNGLKVTQLNDKHFR